MLLLLLFCIVPLGCDFCPQWYHPRCLGLSDEETVRVLQLSTWRCPECIKKQESSAAASTAAADGGETLLTAPSQLASPRKIDQTATFVNKAKRSPSQELQPSTKKARLELKRYGMVLFSWHMKVSFLYNLEVLGKNLYHK